MPRGFSMGLSDLRRSASAYYGSKEGFELPVESLAEDSDSRDKTDFGCNEDDYPNYGFMADVRKGDDEFGAPAQAGKID
jgi:hypothetical protein